MSNKFNNNPVITLISASYNCAETIEKSILSIIPHLSNYIEFIIIDGGSSDKTVQIIKKYENYLAYWISEKDNGIYDAWNKGILKSNGKYIAFLGLDDFCCENYSTAYLNKVTENPDLDFISSKMIMNNSEKRIFGYPWIWEKFRKQMDVVHPGALHNRKLFEKNGLYNIEYKIAGDYEFLLRVGNKLNAAFIDLPTVIFSLDGISNTKSYQLAREIRKAKIRTKARSLLMINSEYLLRLSIAFLSSIKNYFQ
jgi:glycosyltransferase involved in cell wall biosynthesis